MEPIWRIGLAEVGWSAWPRLSFTTTVEMVAMGLVDTTAQEESHGSDGHHNWLVVWNMNFICPYIGNVIPTDSLVFFKIVKTTNQMSMDQSFRRLAACDAVCWYPLWLERPQCGGRIHPEYRLSLCSWWRSLKNDLKIMIIIRRWKCLHVLQVASLPFIAMRCLTSS